FRTGAWIETIPPGPSALPDVVAPSRARYRFAAVEFAQRCMSALMIVRRPFFSRLRAGVWRHRERPAADIGDELVQMRLHERVHAVGINWHHGSSPRGRSCWVLGTVARSQARNRCMVHAKLPRDSAVAGVVLQHLHREFGFFSRQFGL